MITVSAGENMTAVQLVYPEDHHKQPIKGIVFIDHLNTVFLTLDIK